MEAGAVNRVHRVEVVDTQRLGPDMIRVVFGGDDLAEFVSTGVGDEYVRLFLPAEGHAEPLLPVPTDDGYWAFPEGHVDTVVRTYTVRAWDPASALLTIDFVVHDGGVAATWAQGASAGDIAGVNTPRAMYASPQGIEWQLLVADLTGLPAALRIAEQSPAGVRTRVVIEDAQTAGDRDVEIPSGAELAWVAGGNGKAPSRLEEIVRHATFPDGPGYVWVAGEARPTRAVRRYLRHVLGWPSDAYKVVGYWTENSEQWMQRYGELPADLRTHLQEMWSDKTRDVEDVTDEYEQTLETYGL